MYSLTTRRSRQGLLAALAVTALLLMPASAMAAGSTSGGYTDKGVDAQQQVQGGPATPSADSPSSDNGTPGTGDDSVQKAGNNAGTLPFTGLEVGFILAAGLALAGVGFGLRRVARDTA